jgi:hypothetical protein
MTQMMDRCLFWNRHIFSSRTGQTFEGVAALTRHVYWVPLVTSVYPVMLLAAGNDPTEVRPKEVIFLALASVLIAGLALLLSMLVIRNSLKASMITLLFILGFFFYSQIKTFFNGFDIGDEALGRHRYVLPGLAFVSLLLSAFILYWKKEYSRLVVAIGLAVIVLTLFNGAKLMYGWATTPTTVTAASLPDGPGIIQDAPDIYWLMFDGYGRSDVLLDLYDHDNQSFLTGLRERGFYIAENSHANYMSTHLSIPATMSMDHIAGLSDDELEAVLSGRHLLHWYFDSTTLANTAVDLGYDVHAFNAQLAFGFIGFSPFSDRFMDSTVLQTLRATPFSDFVAREAPSRFLSVNEQLIALSSDPNPTFAFSYNLPPHDPYLFNADGTTKQDFVYLYQMGTGPDAAARMKPLYIEQIKFVNSVIQNTVDEILSNSHEPPIIVIQSDHGPISEMIAHQTGTESREELFGNPPIQMQLRERAPILTAILVPESCGSALYSTLSPINTFRLIFDSCLGSNYGLIDDTSYWGSDIEGFTQIDTNGELKLLR